MYVVVSSISPVYIFFCDLMEINTQHQTRRARVPHNRDQRQQKKMHSSIESNGGIIALLGMILAIIYTSVGWNSPTTGLSNKMCTGQFCFDNENVLAISTLIVNSLVGLIVLAHVVGIGFSRGSGGSMSGSSAFSLSVVLPISTMIILATVGVNIANTVTTRDKRGDALGISSVALSGLAVLPVLAMMAWHLVKSM